ncbi:beta-galactosidase-1-like protein 2 isoform X2 [Bradysia coprophila]|uniref:beta-galactosidase-1-like protein 2 isoform X2 n=1 Tax=Bradysia coprophila TaxID=38358 RepID=UPI00187D766A|nr:beta-galactosidase-1-like protein 2 isoform X2 [Bradysia coprophila]
MIQSTTNSRSTTMHSIASLSKWIFLISLFLCVSSQEKTVYEYFADTSVPTGLVAENKQFTLNGKYIRIVSGAIHYFRVHPEQWRDRLRKLRAMGANTVETYVSWNLHEPRMGEFDFGQGGNDFSDFMNIRRFVQIAKEEDLLVILRPGPYICAEWEYGGFPSWLSRDPNMRVRTNYGPFLQRVKLYLDALLSQLVDLQFTRGGSIIAAQIENEYNSFLPKSTEYLEFIRQAFIDNGLDCLYFTSDNCFNSGCNGGTLPGLLQTANFKENADSILTDLLSVQPDKPVMAMEYWTGWFTTWLEEEQGTNPSKQFHDNLEILFDKYNGSVNFYVFHGGVNYGFTAGGGTDWSGEYPVAKADITSYDYDATLSEAGDYTKKYDLAATLIEKYENPKLRRPNRPSESTKIAYPTLTPQRYLTYNDIVQRVPASSRAQLTNAVSMEELPINNNSGQNFGYIIYRKVANVSNGDIYKGSKPQDVAQLLIDDTLVDTGFTSAQPVYWWNNDREISLDVGANGEHTLDLMIEIIARSNWFREDDIHHQKGLSAVKGSKIELNGEEVTDIEHIALEFTGDWVRGLQGWRNVVSMDSLKAPCLVQSTLTITGSPADTFIDMRTWHKGVVFVNGFNIGRYWKVGPQQTLYIPAPLLRTGENQITIFEQYEVGTQMTFSDAPDLGPIAKDDDDDDDDDDDEPNSSPSLVSFGSFIKLWSVAFILYICFVNTH